MSAVSDPQASQSGHWCNQKLCGIDLKVAAIAAALLGGIAYAYFPVAGIALFSIGGAGILASLIDYAVSCSKETLAATLPSKDSKIEWKIMSRSHGSTIIYPQKPGDRAGSIGQLYAPDKAAICKEKGWKYCQEYTKEEVLEWINKLCTYVEEVRGLDATAGAIQLKVLKNDPRCNDPVLMVAVALRAQEADFLFLFNSRSLCFNMDEIVCSAYSYHLGPIGLKKMDHEAWSEWVVEKRRNDLIS